MNSRRGRTELSLGSWSAPDPVDDRSVLADAVAILQDQLWTSGGARAAHYLTHSRAIPRPTAVEYRIGYLPTSHDGNPTSFLTDALRARGYPDGVLVRAGLAMQHGDRGSVVDKPRGGGYLALPLTDPSGAIIGIKFRAVPGEVSENARRFDATSSALAGAMFGFDRLPPHPSTIIAVEGELDQLSLAAACAVDVNLPPAVAWHGKELSGGRLELLAGRTRHVVLMLDADDGGFDGILRGGRKLVRAGVAVEVVRMPDGIDPNDLLCAGDATGLARAVQQLPRVSLFEAHAHAFTRFGPRRVNIARSDPTFVAAELRETAEALACVALDSEAVARGAALVGLDPRHFAPQVTHIRNPHGVLAPFVSNASRRVADVNPPQSAVHPADNECTGASEGRGNSTVGAQ